MSDTRLPCRARSSHDHRAEPLATSPSSLGDEGVVVRCPSSGSLDPVTRRQRAACAGHPSLVCLGTNDVVRPSADVGRQFSNYACNFMRHYEVATLRRAPHRRCDFTRMSELKTTRKRKLAFKVKQPSRERRVAVVLVDPESLVRHSRDPRVQYATQMLSSEETKNHS